MLHSDALRAVAVEVNALQKLREHYEQQSKELAQHLADSNSKLEAAEEQFRKRGGQLEAHSEALLFDVRFFYARLRERWVRHSKALGNSADATAQLLD